MCRVPLAHGVLAMILGLGSAGCTDARNDRVEGTGTVEVDEVNIGALTTGRVAHIWTDEGKPVHRGDTIASLTALGLAQDVQGRQARVRAAEAQLRDLVNGARPPELARAASELEGAEAEAVRTASDLARVAQLAARGIVSRQQLDAAKAAASAAVARRDATRSALALVRDGARPQQVSAARAQLASAQASLQAGLAATSDLLLTSPVDGVVLTRNVSEGEVIAAGMSAVTIGVLSRPWVHVYVGEAALPGIRIGDGATARLDGYPGRTFRGRVVALKDRAEFTPRIALTERERADLVYAVKIALSDPTGSLKPGMPITVRIHSRDAP